MPCCRREVDVPMVGQTLREQMRHERSQPEANSDPFPLARALREGSLRLGSAKREKHVALATRHDHLAVRRGDRKKRPAPLAVTAPDAFDERGIRRPFFESQ